GDLLALPESWGVLREACVRPQLRKPTILRLIRRTRRHHLFQYRVSNRGSFSIAIRVQIRPSLQPPMQSQTAGHLSASSGLSLSLIRPLPLPPKPSPPP